mgnify:CR=1 FL=1
MTTASNQVDQVEKKIAIQTIEEKKISQSISGTQKELQGLVKDFEQSRVEISNYISAYNKARQDADEAAKVAAVKARTAQESKVIADNALEAYRMVSGNKSVISTQKPATISTFDGGENLQSAASAADISRLKQIADQAVARYKKDKAAADKAEADATRLRSAYEKAKATLEAKVKASKEIQDRMRTLQDELAAHRLKLSKARDTKDNLAQQLRKAQAKVTTVQNTLTIAQVEANKAKVRMAQAELVVSRHQNDKKNADKVATANEQALATAQAAIVDVEKSSNSIDKIVASKVVDTSVKTLPLILTAVAIVVAGIFAVVAIMRRRREKPLTPVVETAHGIDFDFDRILSEIRAKAAQPARAAKAPSRTSSATAKKATKKR